MVTLLAGVGNLFSLSSLLLLSGALVIYWVLWIVYTRNFHPLHKIPGPWLASVSRLWYLIRIARGDMEHVQRRLHAKYGPLIRIAPNEVACAYPDAIKTIYRTQGALEKTDFYTVWNNQNFSKHPDMFTCVNDKVHAERRRIINHVYTLSNVLRSEEYIDKCTELFLERMAEYQDGKKPFDLGRWVQMYAFDVIGELYFGRMFGFMETRSDHESWIHSLDLLLPFLCMTAVVPTYVRPLILASSIAVPGSLKAVKAIDTIATAARKCAAKRFSEGKEAKSKDRTDILEQLYTIHQEKGEKVDFNMPEIEQEAWIALFAGSDTTGIALRSVFYHLLKNPSVYKQLMQELDEAAEKGELSSPVKYAEANKLPLLCACIKEAMRLHPSVGLTMSRMVPAEGLELVGQYIPGGYRVGMNAAVVHYDTSIFGPDAADFRPGRWFEDNAATMDKYMLHFGAGTRTCIGKNISLAELHKLVPSVLRKFQLELWEEGQTWRTHNAWFVKQEGLLVRVTPRNMSK
ncbi:Cytochrome P450 monooxygenase gsfF [Exophiala dermatitidis]